jgi:hypothetical protein
MEFVRSFISVDHGLPAVCNSEVGSCNCSFEALLTVHSRYGLHAPRSPATLYTERFDSFVAPVAASIVTGWSETSSRAGLSPAEVQHLSRCTITPTIFPVVCFGSGQVSYS